MFTWKIIERKGTSLGEHLLNTRQDLDNFDFGNLPTDNFYGYNIPDKKLIADIFKASTRIIKAVKNNEKFVIFGHDDVDGITATYILFDFLTSIGSTSHYYYIPNRLTEPPGISESFIRSVVNNGYTLIITVDGGISSVDKIEQLNNLGCDVIVTDHHNIPKILPAAYAIVNPKRKDSMFPDSMLAGVGVVYFMLATIAELLSSKLSDKYLFWTAVGSIADKIPMIGVNRIICKIVLDNWGKLVDRPISLWSNHISINSNHCFDKYNYIVNLIKLLSSGREEQGENYALYFLLSPDYKKRELVSELFKRKAQYEKDVNNVRHYINKKLPSDNDSYYLFYDKEDQIPLSLMGWTSNYLCSMYRIPVIILKNRDGQINGEAKCPPSFDLLQAFEYCSSCLLQYGGHSCAAGFVADIEKYDQFSRLFSEYTEKVKDRFREDKELLIDAEIDQKEIESLGAEICSFAPFGEFAKTPQFLIRKIKIDETFPEAIIKTNIEYKPDQIYDIVFSFRYDGRVIILDIRN